MTIAMLDALTFGETSLDGFTDLGTLEVHQNTAKDETLERILHADVIVTNKVVITREHMLECKNLKLICIAATGMNNVDLDAAKELNIEVKNVAGYSTDSVVQHTFSMLFYLLSHSRYYDEYVKDGSWTQSKLFTHVAQPFSELKGKKWGIIGLGSIGEKVANIAQSFGAEVQYFSTSGTNKNPNYTQTSFSKLLETSDIISIHAPFNDKTNNLLDQSELLIMKDNAILLNLGRGGIVNEDALSRIIDIKNLYVGLDVLKVEPLKANHPLLEIEKKENLYITPHIAWTSVEARERLIQSTIENIQNIY